MVTILLSVFILNHMVTRVTSTMGGAGGKLPPP